MMHHGFWNMGRGIFGMGTSYFWIILLVKAIFWIGVAVLVYKLIKNNKKDPVLEALKMKYVNGEITEEEYINKRNLLKK